MLPVGVTLLCQGKYTVHDATSIVQLNKWVKKSLNRSVVNHGIIKLWHLDINYKTWQATVQDNFTVPYNIDF